MKRLLTALAVLASALTIPAIALPAIAQAAPSLDYCDYSLRGGGTLAPDNDIRIQWDNLQAGGWNLSNTSLASTYIGASDHRHVLYWFNGTKPGGGAGSALMHFECYGSGATYHDVFVRRES